MRRLPLISADFSQLELRVLAAIKRGGGPLVFESVGDIYMESARRTKKHKKATAHSKAVPLQECAPEGYVTGGNQHVVCEVQILEVRPKAIKVTQPGIIDQYLGYAWLPRSLIIAPIGSGHFTVRDRNVKIVIQKWLAIDKGLYHQPADPGDYVLPGEAGSLERRLKKIAQEMKEKGIAIDIETMPALVPFIGEAPGQPEQQPADTCLSDVIKDEREKKIQQEQADERERLAAIRDMERDQPSACARLPLKPQRESFTVSVTDEDLLCDDE